MPGGPPHLARNPQDATDADIVDVVAHLMPVRAVLAKSRDGAIDNLGVHLLYGVIADAESTGYPRPEALQDDIALLGHLHEDGLSLIALEVELHALLVAVKAEKVALLVRTRGDATCRNRPDRYPRS